MKNRDGVREKRKGVYEVNFRPFPKAERFYGIVEAKTLQEARIKRAELIAKKVKEGKSPAFEKDRYNSNFEELAVVIRENLLADSKGRKTVNRFLSCWKTFSQFLKEKHPDIDSINNLKEAHFEDYKGYIKKEKNREKGWRAELTIIKAIFKRFKRKGYCKKEILEELKELKRPPREKKHMNMYRI